MANDINRLVINGRLVRDASLKYTNSGFAVCEFDIAVNKEYLKDGEKIKTVSYFPVVLWGKLGEAISGYLTKGKQITVDGEIKQEQWHDKEGKKRSTIKIIANSVQMIGGKNEDSYQPNNNLQQPPLPVDDFEDDIPF